MRNAMIVLLVLGVLLAVTNPGAADFNRYFRNSVVTDLAQSAQDPVSRAVYSALTKVPDGTADGALSVLGWKVEQHDFILGSVYVLRNGTKVYRVIGILKNFVQIPGS